MQRQRSLQVLRRRGSKLEMCHIQLRLRYPVVFVDLCNMTATDFPHSTFKMTDLMYDASDLSLMK